MPKQAPAPAKSGMLGARTVMELQRITEKRRARDMREIREELKAIRAMLPVELAPVPSSGGLYVDQDGAFALMPPSPAAAGTAASATTRGSFFRRLATWWR